MCICKIAIAFIPVKMWPNFQCTLQVPIMCLYYVCVKIAPDSTKMRQIKCKKSNFSGGACPRTPLLSHIQSIWISPHTNYPPIIPHFQSLGQKPERNPAMHNIWSYINCCPPLFICFLHQWYGCYWLHLNRQIWDKTLRS